MIHVYSTTLYNTTNGKGNLHNTDSRKVRIGNHIFTSVQPPEAFIDPLFFLAAACFNASLNKAFGSPPPGKFLAAAAFGL